LETLPARECRYLALAVPLADLGEALMAASEQRGLSTHPDAADRHTTNLPVGLADEHRECLRVGHVV